MNKTCILQVVNNILTICMLCENRQMSSRPLRTEKCISLVFSSKGMPGRWRYVWFEQTVKLWASPYMDFD